MNGKRYGRGLIAAFSALVAVVAIILAVFVISGDEADLSYRSVDFDARLQSNGDIRFTEHLDYQLKRREDGNGDTKPWKQLYLTFKLRNQDLTNITDISVTNASTGEEYTQTDPQLPSGISDGTWDSTYAGHWYIADTTAGFVCYRREVLETIELDRIHFKGYAFQIEMKFTAYKCGFKITEVPIIFINRELGVSKMSGGIFGEAVFGVLRLKFWSWFRKYPQKSKQ